MRWFGRIRSVPVAGCADAERRPTRARDILSNHLAKAAKSIKRTQRNKHARPFTLTLRTHSHKLLAVNRTELGMERSENKKQTRNNTHHFNVLSSIGLISTHRSYLLNWSLPFSRVKRIETVRVGNCVMRSRERKHHDNGGEDILSDNTKLLLLGESCRAKSVGRAASERSGKANLLSRTLK